MSLPLPFSSVAVIGPGLLGGSVAMAVRAQLPSCHVRLWARRAAPLELATRMGIADVVTQNLQEAVRGAQLVILATPIGTFADLAQAMLPALAPEAVVTDVGSVKAVVHETVGALLAARGISFIGSHPMAGAEKQGLEHARADLLQGATVALTNPHAVPEDQVSRLAEFWRMLGAHPCEMQPEQHDQAVARISHVPHVLAALCARCATAGEVPTEDLQRLASSGFRDTTRVSSGGSAMWADILWGNAPAIRQALADSVSDLQTLLNLLERQDKDALCSWLEQARLSREQVQQGR